MKTDSGALSNLLVLGKSIRNDVGGWFNTLTGLGVEGRDKRLGSSIQFKKLTQQEVEDLFAQDDISHRVVATPPDLATKNWIEMNIAEEDGGVEVVKKIKNEHDRLQLKDKYREAQEQADLYGGAGIYFNVQDGRKPDEPLNKDGLLAIKSLHVFDRYELQPRSINVDIDSPNYLLPEEYDVTPRYGGLAAGQGTFRVHHSRIMRFDGAKLPKRLFVSNNYWHDSVLTKLFNALRNFNTSHDSAATIMQDFRIGIVKIKNLADIISSGNGDLLKGRIETMNLCKSTLGSIMLDAEDESFEHLTSSLNGLENLLDRINNRLVAATDMPHTIVLGEGATGTLGGGGESEMKNLKNFVSGYQSKKFDKNIDRANELIMLQNNGPTKGKVFDSFTWEYGKIDEETINEILDAKQKLANIDNIYWNMGALESSEIRNSRFGGREFSYETSIETEEENRIDSLGHVHSDPLGGYSGDAVMIDGETPTDSPLHFHKRPNGTLTGPAEYLPDGTHIHRTRDDVGKKSNKQTHGGPAISLEQLDLIKIQIAKNEGDI